MRSWRLMCLVLSVWLAIVAGTAAARADRVALVIGNSNYDAVPFLPNAARDARDMADALRGIGFAVYDGYDLGRREMLELTAQVTGRLQADDVALFYFSGHGIQLGAQNFIIPVDARGRTEADLQAASVSLQAVLREMELRSDRNIVILDACRNNPFQSRMITRSLGGATRGLARVDAGVGSYIAFSTQPGNVALDGAGRNSPFTGALLRHLNAIDDDVHELMRKVRADVVDATGGSQVPWENSSLIEQIFLSQPAGRGARPMRERRDDDGLQIARLDEPEDQRFLHMVAGLDPGGDGFLSLRAGPTAQSERLARMSEGTRLSVLDQSGVWFRVRTRTGLEGWAHSNWIRFTGARAPEPEADTCEALWYERNAYFHRRGYCFGSERGQRAFSNEGCIAGMAAGDVPLTAAERDAIDRIVARERELGCR